MRWSAPALSNGLHGNLRDGNATASLSSIKLGRPSLGGVRPRPMSCPGTSDAPVRDGAAVAEASTLSRHARQAEVRHLSDGSSAELRQTRGLSVRYSVRARSEEGKRRCC